MLELHPQRAALSALVALPDVSPGVTLESLILFARICLMDTTQRRRSSVQHRKPPFLLCSPSTHTEVLPGRTPLHIPHEAPRQHSNRSPQAKVPP